MNITVKSNSKNLLCIHAKEVISTLATRIQHRRLIVFCRLIREVQGSQPVGRAANWMCHS